MSRGNAEHRGRMEVREASEGMTLIEVMIAAVVLAVGLIGLMSSICSSMVVDNVAQENNLALDVARQVMEQARSESFDTLGSKADAESRTDGGSAGYADYRYTIPGLTGTWYAVTEGTKAGVAEIDANGNFDVSLPHIGRLEPWGNDTDGKVGHVAPRKVSDDVLEITVTKGHRGPTVQVLRGEIGDWGA